MSKLPGEERVSHNLRSILAPLAVGAEIAETDERGEVCVGLAWFIQYVLGEKYWHWRKDESLEGVFIERGRKTGDNAAELAGLVFFITDLTVSPFHLRLRLAASDDEIEWLELRVGEAGSGTGHMVRTPYGTETFKKAEAVMERIDAINWAYAVTYGENNPAPDS